MRRLRHRNEEGMTLIEVIVTLALTAIVMAMATYIVINVLNETTGEAASIQGVQEAQLAERSFTQYLRSAVSLLSIQTNDITFTAYSGVKDTTVSSTTIPIPQLQTIEAQLCPTKSPYVDSLEVIYGLPPAPAAGSSGLHECISPNSPTTTTVSVPSGARLVEAFDITPPAAGTDIFTYFQFSGGAFIPFASTAAASADPAAVAAIAINLTFLPPPASVTKTFHTEFGTTLRTEIYLRNSSSATTTTTTSGS
ncbi:MAG: PulJ/GspJ family protein [Acidimicrobiales bacterium]